MTRETCVFRLRILNPVGALVSSVRHTIDRLRLAKLVNRGLKLGKNCYIMEGVEFDAGYPFLIEIGANCRIAKGVRILAHDASAFCDLGVTRIAPVRILEGTFVGERTIILPGVTIGPRALIAAGSFVNRDMGEDVVAAGNPARPYGKFSDVLAKMAETAVSSPIFSKDDIENGAVTQADLIEALTKAPAAFIRGVPKKDPYYVNADYAEIRANTVRAFETEIAARLPRPADAHGDYRPGTPATDDAV